jgi:4-hydroxy-2-oxoheptanedioate aldolase
MTQDGFLAGLGGDGPPLLGLFVTMPVPAGVEVAGLAGYDFVIIDLEHTSLVDSDVEDLSRAARLHGMFTMVRTVDSREAGIGRVIETGADGILVPMVEDAATAARIVAATRTSPAGTRGISSSSRAAGLSIGPPMPPPVCGVEIESAAGVEHLEEILAVPGLDMVFVGPGDLRASLARRHPGASAEQLADELARAVARVAACVASVPSVALGLPATYPLLNWDNSKCVANGVRVATLGTDISVLASALLKNRRSFSQDGP